MLHCKGQLQLSLEAAMLFAPFGCTHPPPLFVGTETKSQDITEVASQAESYMTMGILRRCLSIQEGVRNIMKAFNLYCWR